MSEVNMWAIEDECRAEGYTENDPRLGFINHATGHRPTAEALDAGYDFLDKWLK